MKRVCALLLLALASFGLPGSGCDGNLGDVSAGPVSFRVSAATNFFPADGPSTRPTTNVDGTRVAFESRALNLTRTEPSFKEILLRDRVTQTVTSVSRLVFDPNKAGLADCEDPAMSADGEWVIFTSRRDLPSPMDPPAAETFSTLWRWNRGINDVSIIVPTLPFASPETPIDGDCFSPAVSADGTVIAFSSLATNIETVPAYVSAGTFAQIFAVDINGGATRLLSHAFGAPGTPCNMAASNPVVSADGQWIVFTSRATDLVSPAPATSHRRIYRASLDGSVVELVSRLDGVAGTPSDNHCGSPSVNADGSLVAFAFQGGNLAPAPNSGILGFPLIVRDFNALGGPANRVIADDCFLFGLFPSVSNPFADDSSTMSDDGRSVVYMGVKPGLQDVVVRVADTAGGGTRALSKGVFEQGVTVLEDLFSLPTLSGDGRWAFWRADYSQEVIGDTNALGDVFGYGPLR